MPRFFNRRQFLAATAAVPLIAHDVRAADDGTDVPDPYKQDGASLPPSPPSPTPKPTATSTPKPVEGAIFPNNRVLSYYGFPGNPNMGVLGEYDKDDLLAKLQDQAAEYQAADSSRPWKLAFEVIATVAQADPGADGLYIVPTGSDIIQEYIDYTAANDLLLILDVQFGLDTVQNQLNGLREYLRYPHVHPALDPEFMMAPGEQPGVDLGSISGGHVTDAQQLVAKWAREDGVPEKFLVVHQFNYYMITDKDAIGVVDGVQLVIDADGWGPPSDKQASWNVVIEQDPIQFNGIKNFYGQDDPMLSAAETMAFTPTPDLVIYQ